MNLKMNWSFSIFRRSKCSSFPPTGTDLFHKRQWLLPELHTIKRGCLNITSRLLLCYSKQCLNYAFRACLRMALLLRTKSCSLLSHCASDYPEGLTKLPYVLMCELWFLSLNNDFCRKKKIELHSTHFKSLNYGFPGIYFLQPIHTHTQRHTNWQ